MFFSYTHFSWEKSEISLKNKHLYKHSGICIFLFNSLIKFLNFFSYKVSFGNLFHELTILLKKLLFLSYFLCICNFLLYNLFERVKNFSNRKCVCFSGLFDKFLLNFNSFSFSVSSLFCMRHMPNHIF